MTRFPDNPSKAKYSTIPTEEDWGDYQDDLDANSAHEVFAGRTNEEMQPRWRDNVIERTDDLRWMPEIPFRYYMRGFRDFVMAGDFNRHESSDAASCFLRLVINKLESHPRYIMPIMPELFPAIEYVARNQSVYDANEDIYGSFLDLLKQIHDLYEKCGGAAYSAQLNVFLKK